MGALNDKINADIKSAMLAGDKELVGVLRLLKSAVLYSGVEAGNRDDMSDEQILTVLKKESKKRQDAIEMYSGAGDTERKEKEAYEKEIIDKYLPEMMSEEEVEKIVDEAIKETGQAEQKNMGMIISKVKEKSNGLAEGSLIAKIVRGKINS